jgi:hypothetical protein
LKETGESVAAEAKQDEEAAASVDRPCSSGVPLLTLETDGAAENLGKKRGERETNTKRFVFSEIKEEGQVVSAGNV